MYWVTMERRDEWVTRRKMRSDQMGGRLRLAALYQGAGIEVDKDDHVLRGVSLIQAVEALGHGVMVDETTLDEVVELGNASAKGIKSRFTHPGLSSDGLGKFLGRIRGLRQEGDKVVGDLYLSALAFKSPTDGNLGDYILERAEEDPASFGLSIVADGSYVWRTEDGQEIDAGEPRPPTRSMTYRFCGWTTWWRVMWWMSRRPTGMGFSRRICGPATRTPKGCIT